MQAGHSLVVPTVVSLAGCWSNGITQFSIFGMQALLTSMVFESQHSVHSVVEHFEHLASNTVQDSHLFEEFRKNPS